MFFSLRERSYDSLLLLFPFLLLLWLADWLEGQGLSSKRMYIIIKVDGTLGKLPLIYPNLVQKSMHRRLHESRMTPIHSEESKWWIAQATKLQSPAFNIICYTSRKNSDLFVSHQAAIDFRTVQFLKKWPIQTVIRVRPYFNSFCLFKSLEKYYIQNIWVDWRTLELFVYVILTR